MAPRNRAEGSVGGSSFAGSAASSASADSQRRRTTKDEDGRGDDFIDRRNKLETGVFGVLFTLSKESSETRIRIRWILLKILLDGWQLFSTVVEPELQGWDINPHGRIWPVVNVLNFTWLADMGYSVYLALLYAMVVLLGINIGLCVWVAWCFKEQKFPAVWPIKVLQVFTAFFFHAFDVASLNLLQLGISCRYVGPAPKMHLDLMPQYSCAAFPQLIHSVVSALALVLFVIIAMLLNMAEVEVNPLSRRPFALGHSGSEVAAFGIKVLLTMVNVFFPWPKVVSCLYLVLAVALAWQYLRHPGHLVQWVSDLKAGVSIAVVWCSFAGVLLVFRPGVSTAGVHAWAHGITVMMLAGMGPAFVVGALWSNYMTKRMTRIALAALAEKQPNVPLQDVCYNLDDPRDVEIVARCGRTWLDRYNVAPDAIAKAQGVIKAGLAMFPSSAYMVLVHANFMIDVLGVSQSGGRRIEAARKLNPDLMCRFIMFVRQQQATQRAAGHNANEGASMDLLGYVEYQRKQRMVVRLHQEALQAMCSFWKVLDAHTVSFTRMARLLGRIEGSVSQAQAAYRVVLENYGSNPKLVRLYGKFLEGCKYDPWGAQEYYTEADRLEEVKSGVATGPLLPDGTPLSRMDDMAVGVLVINAAGEVQMANKMAYTMFGYKRGTLDSKPLVMLLAQHSTRTLVDSLASLVAASSLVMGENADDTAAGVQPDAVVVAMHSDRVAFSAKMSIRKASGVGEDSTFITLWEPLPPVKGEATLWVAPSGDIAACDPQFVSITGWKASEITGANVSSLLSMSDATGQAVAADEGSAQQQQQHSGNSGAEMVARLLAQAANVGDVGASLPCFGLHKFDDCPLACAASIVRKDGAVHELRIRLTAADPPLLMVVNRAGAIKYASVDLVASLKDNGALGGAARHAGGLGPLRGPTAGGADQAALLGAVTSSTDQLAAFTLSDFLLPYWKELHTKLLKDATATSAPSRNPLACRKDAGQQGATQELRTLGGKPLYMRVSVAATDMMGEMVHVVRMSRSSLETCLSERRLRLTVSSQGLITDISKETPASLFGLDPSTVVGRGLYELVDESLQGDGDAPRPEGERAFAALVQRSLAYPGCSWRVHVAPPLTSAAAASCVLSAAARAARVKPAVMQVQVMDQMERTAGDAPAELGMFVDLWPTASVTGVLSVDGQGRVTAVLEEATRPAGLLFGLASQSLVGETLDALLELPAERSTPADLMTSLGAKKSNLRSSKHSEVKVGPMHVLRGSHSDGRGPVTLSVQLVGKPEPNEPATVLLRLNATPLAPAPMSGSGVPPPPAPWASSAPGPASQRVSQLGYAAAAIPGMPRRLATRDGAPAAASRFAKVEPSPTAMRTASAVRGSEDSTDVGMFLSPPTLPPPPVLNPNGLDDGVTSRAAEASSRDKLGGLVKSLGGGGGGRRSSIGSRPPGSHGNTASGGVADAAAAGELQVLESVLLPGSPQTSGARGSLELHAAGLVQPGGGADDRPASNPRLRSALSARPVDVREQAGLNLAGDSATSIACEPGAGRPGSQRISTWVASKGAFYQNAAPTDAGSDTSPQASDDDDLAPRVSPGAGAATKRFPKGAAALVAASDAADGAQTDAGARGARGAPGQDEDAPSEGGTSNHSGTGGAEYKRGKRFRKLAKMLDSGTAQQTLQRLRVHALWVVGLLVVCHVVCFVMTKTALVQQQVVMLAIGRAGQSQRFMHLIMADVRSLDVISQNLTRSSPNLPVTFNASSVPFLLERIRTSADQVKTRWNEVLAAYHKPSSPILHQLYYVPWTVYNGVDSNGTELWTTTTVWDFTTRFFSLARNVQEMYYLWQAEGTRITTTFAGEFLLKSGPDLFVATRNVLDALLFDAVKNSKSVQQIQYIFLAVEGGIITSLAACYLAVLLRAVAAQRYKLYSTFLAVPVGLTRALAIDNTTLLAEDAEDDGEDGDDNPVKEADASLDAQAKGVGPRARLAGDGRELNRVTSVVSVRDVGLTGRDAAGNADDVAAKKERDHTSSSHQLLEESGQGDQGGGWHAFSKFKSLFGGSRWGSRRMPRTGSLSGASTKRALKADSHDTAYLLMPFVFWSVLVIIFYAVAVLKMEGVVDAVAVHSVINFMTAGTSRAVFFAQELAVATDPVLLDFNRARLHVATKFVRDAWYTIQLGSDAYLAAGNDTERFPLVKVGASQASPKLVDIIYNNGDCHRYPENLPCPGSDYRYWKVVLMGVDAIVNRFMRCLNSMTLTAGFVGLDDANYNFAYLIGSKDLLDGTREVKDAHYSVVIALFNQITTYHIILFVILWIVFAAWILVLLNPLCKRVAKERRRIAEMMSQLPLELDVEKLVSRALGTVSVSTSAGRRMSIDMAATGAELGPGLDGQNDAANKWKAIIRTASSLAGKNAINANGKNARSSLDANGKNARSSIGGMSATQ